MSALDGVGPSIARANQVPSGSCADLPVAPSRNSNPTASTTSRGSADAWAKTSL